MQAVILAAGRGTRMKELTEVVPKPLLTVDGATLLHHKLAALPDSVDEVVFIVGYHGEKIKEEFGSAYEGRKMTYVVQDTLDGTAGALWRAREVLRDRFLVMMGDDLYGKEDIRKMAESPDWAILVSPSERLSSGGRVITDITGKVIAIEEGDHTGKAGLMNTNMFTLDTRLFGYPMVPKAPGSEEFGLPQSVLAAAEKGSIPLHAETATFWLQITAPEDLPRAEAILKKQK